MHSDPTRAASDRAIGFTLIELLVVITIIALLIALLLPALKKSRDATWIAVCANNEHQLAVGFHTYGADNGGDLPPGGGYLPPGHVPNRAVRDSGDFWDVLNPAYVEPKEVWYCPASSYSADTVLYNGSTFWELPTLYPGCCVSDGANGYFGYAFLNNAYLVRNFYENIPTHLDDPSGWVLILDHTRYDVELDHYRLTNHPGTPEGWGTIPNATFPPDAKPDGTNKCTLDGSVTWVPEAETKLGYPGCGGVPGSLWCHIIE